MALLNLENGEVILKTLLQIKNNGAADRLFFLGIKTAVSLKSQRCFLEFLRKMRWQLYPNDASLRGDELLRRIPEETGRNSLEKGIFPEMVISCNGYLALQDASLCQIFQMVQHHAFGFFYIHAQESSQTSWDQQEPAACFPFRVSWSWSQWSVFPS